MEKRGVFNMNSRSAFLGGIALLLLGSLPVGQSAIMSVDFGSRFIKDVLSLRDMYDSSNFKIPSRSRAGERSFASECYVGWLVFTVVAMVQKGKPFHIVVDETSKRKVPAIVAFDGQFRCY
eukprot:1294645-Amorphochlora_amoeboformis.AAC.1